MAVSNLHSAIKQSIKDNKTQNVFYRVPFHGNIPMLFVTIQEYYKQLGFLVSLKQNKQNSFLITVSGEKLTNRFVEFSHMMNGLLEDMKKEKVVVMYKSTPHAKKLYYDISTHYTMPWKYSLELLEDDIKITKR